MSALPIAAFPVGAKATGASGFAIAVLVGLTLYLAAQNRQPQSNKN